MSQVLLHDQPRKATWFELFFDLVFVVAVASLANRFAEHYDWTGALQFAALFLVLWWLWLGHTFQASRFDEGRPDQWAVGFAQMIAVVFIGYGASDAFGARAWAFAGGVAAFKGLLAVSYLREMARPGVARLCQLYGSLYAVQSALWAASILFDGQPRLYLWGMALLVDLVSPFLVAKETHRAPPHPEHLPERFGLFTIILLGETAAAAVHALDHGDTVHAETIAIALMGAVLGFLYWIGYFRRANATAERHITTATEGRSLRLWAYGHIPLYLGIGCLGAGTVYLAHHADAHASEPWIFAMGAALAMLGVTIVSSATARRPLRTSLPYLAIAVLAAGAPMIVPSIPGLFAVMIGLCAVQLLLSVWQAARTKTP